MISIGIIIVKQLNINGDDRHFGNLHLMMIVIIREIIVNIRKENIKFY
ncbi:MAG TPA: hypothetical protein VKA87_03380 [Nitrososphaeraceae archaeon]|nr:hypothetical protein [Nitrososphaeraceae archaeon]